MRGPVVLFALAALFVVELLAWLTLAMWGWTIGSHWGDAAGAIGTVVAFAAVVTAWGLLAAPKSRAPGWVRWTVKVLILGGAAVTLVITGQPAAGIALAALAAILLWVAETKVAREVRDALSAPRDHG